MHAQKCVTQLASSVSLCQDIRDSVKIAYRLCHFLAVHQQMRAMQPVTHELLSRHAFALRDLRLVMREDVIDAAAMDVDLIAQQRHGHRAALDVPAWTARSPR